VVHRRTLKANFTAPSAKAPNTKLSVGTRKAFHENTNANSWKQRQGCKCSFQKDATDSLPPTPIPSLIQKGGMGFKVRTRSKHR
jgi:hypothetical protein